MRRALGCRAQRPYLVLDPRVKILERPRARAGFGLPSGFRERRAAARRGLPVRRLARLVGPGAAALEEIGTGNALAWETVSGRPTGLNFPAGNGLHLDAFVVPELARLLARHRLPFHRRERLQAADRLLQPRRSGSDR